MQRSRRKNNQDFQNPARDISQRIFDLAKIEFAKTTKNITSAKCIYPITLNL